jgi:hypothetical protein
MNDNTPAAYGDIFDALERNRVRYVVVSGDAGHGRPD